VIVAQDANVAIRVTQQVVDANGVVQANPLSGIPVTISIPALFSLSSVAAQTTDASGQIIWSVHCNQSGSVTVSFLLPTMIQTLIANCIEQPVTTTTGSTTSTIF